MRRWSTIVVLWLLGVCAAAQLAKFSTIAPLLQEQFGLSLAATRMLISLLEIGGAVFGFVAGLALGQVGCRRSLLTGLALLAGASLVEAFAAGPSVMFTARAVEGVGYLLVVIAAPTAIAAIASDADRSRALALWSSFVPVGIAVGGAVTSMSIGPLGSRGVMLAWAILLGVLLIPLARLQLERRTSGRILLPRAAAWISTFAFGLYTLFLCALTMLLPIFLVGERDADLSDAGLIASFASLSALPASGLAMLLVRQGSLSARRLVVVATLSLVATSLLAPVVFGDETRPLAMTSLIAVAAVALSSLVSPLIFARLPVLAGATSPHDPRIAAVNGLLTQFGAGGALLGPPLGGLIVGYGGWPALGIAISALAMLMLASILAAEWIAAREGRDAKVAI